EVRNIVQHPRQLVFNLPRGFDRAVRVGFCSRDSHLDRFELADELGFADFRIGGEGCLQKLKQAVFLTLAGIAREKQPSTLKLGTLGAVCVREQLLKFRGFLWTEIARLEEVAHWSFGCLCQVSPQFGNNFDFAATERLSMA